MSGEIEVALFGVCASEPALRMSKASKPYCQFSLGVGEGEARKWVRVCCFGETAEKVAAQLKKGGKAYCEGTLDVGVWQPEGKPPTANLNVAARRVEVLGQIGRNRSKEPLPTTSDSALRRQPVNGRPGPSRGYDHDFNDPIDF
jgi:single-stranded DNA-binding protein